MACMLSCRDGAEMLTSDKAPAVTLAFGREKMSRLLLSNIDPDTSDEEIQAFLEKYGFPPFDSLDPAVLGKLQQRIDHMYWKKRQLSASILHDRFA